MGRTRARTFGGGMTNVTPPVRTGMNLAAADYLDADRILIAGAVNQAPPPDHPKRVGFDFAIRRPGPPGSPFQMTPARGKGADRGRPAAMRELQFFGREIKIPPRWALLLESMT